jgi:hypothetical protein
MLSLVLVHPRLAEAGRRDQTTPSNLPSASVIGNTLCLASRIKRLDRLGYKVTVEAA